MNWLENKYTYLIGGRCRNFKRVSDSVFNFSCPICGDSKKHRRKARGYVVSKLGKVKYTCHKCGYHEPFHVFMKQFDSSMYDEYQKERIEAGFWKPRYRRIANPVPAQSATKPEAVIGTGTPASFDPLSPLTRVDRLKPEHYARVLCEKRAIPDLTRLYHCPKFYAWTNWVLKAEKFNEKACKYFDHARLIIPFHIDGVMTAFQGRDYKPDSDNKYITIRVDEEAPKIFGLDEVDETQKLYAVEGPIDSLFLPNCIAFAGGTHSGVPEEAVIVYDNEPWSKHTRKKMANAIYDGYSVCIWPNWVEQKDVNDMVLAGVDVQRVIDQHTYRGLSAQLELKKWQSGSKLSLTSQSTSIDAMCSGEFDE